MPKITQAMTDKAIKVLKETTAIGGVCGLYCEVRTLKDGTLSRLYTLRVSSPNGKRQHISLGNIKDLTLAEARAKAAEMREKIRKGVHIASEKRLDRTERAATVPAMLPKYTLEAMFTEWLEAQSARGKWKKDQKTIKDDLSRFNNYLPRAIRTAEAATITATEMAEGLRPQWLKTHESVRRLCMHLSAAYLWAGYNKKMPMVVPPCRLEGLSDILPIYKNPKGHHPALPAERLPEFFRTVWYDNPQSSALFSMFAILTTARVGSIFTSTWNDIYEDAATGKMVHRIPRERMKVQDLQADRLTPLSKEAMAVLRRVPRACDNSYVFSFRGEPLNEASHDRYLKRLNERMTAKGMLPLIDPQNERVMTLHGTARASFKDWALDAERFGHEPFEEKLIERCLDHKEGYNSAYMRTQPIGEMMKVYEAWGAYCFSLINLAEGV